MLDNTVECVFSNVISWAKGLFQVESVSYHRLFDLLVKSFKIGDTIYGENEAIVWANGFKFPNTIIEESNYLFKKCGYDFGKLVRSKLFDIKENRLSVESVHRCISEDNPERDKLLIMASEGLPLFPDPEAKFNGPDNIPSLSYVYKRTAAAVNKMLYEDFVAPGLAFILDGKLIDSKLAEFHLSRLSWTAKQGKVKGRPIVDCSAGELNLNSVYTKTKSDEVWGIIQHPTINDVVLMILEFADSVDRTNLNDVVLWKVDLKGAYTLLSFNPDVVHLLGGKLDDGNYIFFMSGIFGWSGTPAAFQVVTRALVFECQKRLSGRIKMYVDDMIGVCLKSQVDSELAIVKEVCCGLFNSDCIESSKTVVGRVIDFIGYTINLDDKFVSVSERNYLKCIYGFCSINFQNKVELKFVEKLASWAARYSVICKYLTPFVYSFYNETKGKFRHQSFQLSEEVKLNILIFRAIFILSILNEVRFTRSFNSFVIKKSSLLIEFDASLFGGGCLFYKISDHGVEECLGTMMFNLQCLNFGCNSSFQNSAEFITAVLSLIGAIKLFDKFDSVTFRGDSLSALSWCFKERAKSISAKNSSILFILVLLHFNIQIYEVVHIPAEDNCKCDLLSRASSFNEVIKQNSVFNSINLLVYDYHKFLNIINHVDNHQDPNSFITFWNKAMLLINSIKQHN